MLQDIQPYHQGFIIAIIETSWKLVELANILGDHHPMSMVEHNTY